MKIRIDNVKDYIGRELGASRPMLVTQERINLFADATDDHQWIHTDPERAAKGPFGTTVAHGYLTLSLLPVLLDQVLTVEGASLTVNYGLNKLRFPSPVPAGSEVVATAVVTDVTPITGGVQLVLGFTVSAVGAAKPSAVGDAVYNYYF